MVDAYQLNDIFKTLRGKSGTFDYALWDDKMMAVYHLEIEIGDNQMKMIIPKKSLRNILALELTPGGQNVTLSPGSEMISDPLSDDTRFNDVLANAKDIMILKEKIDKLTKYYAPMGNVRTLEKEVGNIIQQINCRDPQQPGLWMQLEEISKELAELRDRVKDIEEEQ